MASRQDLSESLRRQVNVPCPARRRKTLTVA